MNNPVGLWGVSWAGEQGCACTPHNAASQPCGERAPFWPTRGPSTPFQRPPLHRKAPPPHLGCRQHHFAAPPLRRRLVHFNGPPHRARRCREGSRKRGPTLLPLQRRPGTADAQQETLQQCRPGQVAEPQQEPLNSPQGAQPACRRRLRADMIAAPPPPTVLALRDLGLCNVLLDQRRLNVLRTRAGHAARGPGEWQQHDRRLQAPAVTQQRWNGAANSSSAGTLRSLPRNASCACTGVRAQPQHRGVACAQLGIVGTTRYGRHN